jgi:CDP-diacylglycerol--glycerol-3-phosphate 3-phosphatidyltransferase
MILIKYFPHWLQPNHLTILRLLLLAPIIYCFLHEYYVLMVVFFVIAAITDMFDGPLARERNHQTTIGAFLDPIADRLLFFIPLFLLAYNQINKNILLISLTSEILLFFLAFSFSVLLKCIKVKYLNKATTFGKIKCVLQIIAMFFLFLFLFIPYPIFTQISTCLIIASIFFLYLSLIKNIVFVIRNF